MFSTSGALSPRALKRAACRGRSLRLNSMQVLRYPNSHLSHFLVEVHGTDEGITPLSPSPRILNPLKPGTGDIGPRSFGADAVETSTESAVNEDNATMYRAGAPALALYSFWASSIRCAVITSLPKTLA